jgi:hypothetical protein
MKEGFASLEAFVAEFTFREANSNCWATDSGPAGKPHLFRRLIKLDGMFLRMVGV